MKERRNEEQIRAERAAQRDGQAGSERLPMELHIRAAVRRRYGVDQALFQSSGNVLLGNPAAVRALTQAINERRRADGGSLPPVRAGQLYAFGLIDEIMHYVVSVYRRDVDADALTGCDARIAGTLGETATTQLYARFVEEFPPTAVYRGELSSEDYLAGTSSGRGHREIALEELMLLALTNENPAAVELSELFDDSTLRQTSEYALPTIDEHFAQLPPFGPEKWTLLEMLRAPMRASPYSLAGQLRFMREHWGILIGKFLDRLLLSSDLLAEEETPRFAGPGPSRVMSFESLSEDAERFSEDRDWMPNVVLIAKSVYVWLWQLSERYGRPIRRLDEIPDAELDRFAAYGFNALWLIGLWERSPASREIKRISGNPEALASAYAIDDYVIASELGGEEAFGQLRERAARRGLRMAGDMVPNHMGLDSRWVMEHPHWFVQLDHPPFPSYSFNGADLAPGRRAVVQIEDGYWSRSDAAVVFRWIDRGSGETRYIYHGNDGTSMPWNDTAQLNFMLAEVREAVIQTILHVARKFPVIRFDAAMILTKQHYSRLWFPPPGHGGAIPSRAGRGFTAAEFNAAFPVEFWREVVDRIAQEAPDTLLLAEAFWLLEGYFVRTLGMHRVYNSAFMNMLKDEENEKYRSVIKNVLAFNPRILERFVNFMNNPDEEPAAEQFGSGDKYFGVAMMLSTLPGLPMFGHGQLEGLHEKYGMEYSRAYWDETTDDALVARHEREIVPLLKKRYLFSGVEFFTLYDVWRDGGVEENIFAYSNRAGGERALVVYNNRYQTSSGWVRWSVPIATSVEGSVEQRSLVDALGLSNAPQTWFRIYEYRSGLTFLRSSHELAERGFFVSLAGYQYQIYTGFGELRDTDGRYARLAARLQGAGVQDFDAELRWLELEPLAEALRALGAAGRPWTPDSSDARAAETPTAVSHRTPAERKAIQQLFLAMQKESGEALSAPELERRFETVLTRIVSPEDDLFGPLAEVAHRRWLAYAAALLLPLVEASGEPAPGKTLDCSGWMLPRLLAAGAAAAFPGEGEPVAELAQTLGRALVVVSRRVIPRASGQQVFRLDVPLAKQRRALRELFGDPWMAGMLGLSWYDGVEWFNREAALGALRWVATLAAVVELADEARALAPVPALLTQIAERLDELDALADQCEYRFSRLLGTSDEGQTAS